MLEEDSKALDEVVVVAFGTQRKESMISSIETIKPAELKVPSSNLTTALAGRMSGVIAYQRSGEPGKDNADFFIRGVTTFGYKKDPLILIDGIETTTTELARLQPGRYCRILYSERCYCYGIIRCPWCQWCYSGSYEGR